MTYAILFEELRGMCDWQLDANVVVGLQDEIVEVLTMYHDFDLATDCDSSLMLVSTPPDEYFEFETA